MRLLVLTVLLTFAATVNGQNVTCADGSSPTGHLSVTGQGSVKSLPDSATVGSAATHMSPRNGHLTTFLSLSSTDRHKGGSHSCQRN
jgi:hypothetical protein